MKTYALDANAVIRYLSKGRDWEKVRLLLARSLKSEIRIVISVINWGEAIYILARHAGLDEAVRDLKTLGAAVEIIPADEPLTEAAATIKHNYKLGYADSFACAVALRMNATLVTADPEFAKLGKRLRIFAFARHGE